MAMAENLGELLWIRIAMFLTGMSCVGVICYGSLMYYVVTAKVSLASLTSFLKGLRFPMSLMNKFYVGSAEPERAKMLEKTVREATYARIFGSLVPVILACALIHDVMVFPLSTAERIANIVLAL